MTLDISKINFINYDNNINVRYQPIFVNHANMASGAEKKDQMIGVRVSGALKQAYERLAADMRWSLSNACAIALKEWMQQHLQGTPDANEDWLPMQGGLGGGERFQIPVYDTEPTPGRGAVLLNEEIVGRLPVPERLIMELGVFPEDLLAVKISGHSMEPTIRDGQIVLASRLRQIGGGLAPGIYIFRWEGEWYIKRMRPSEEGGAVAFSDNPDPEFETFRISPDPPEGDLHILARVMRVWKRS